MLLILKSSAAMLGIVLEECAFSTSDLLPLLRPLELNNSEERQVSLQLFSHANKRRKLSTQTQNLVSQEVYQLFICRHSGVWNILRHLKSFFDLLGIRGIDEMASAFVNRSSFEWTLHCPELIGGGNAISTLPEVENLLLVRLESMWKRRILNGLQQDGMECIEHEIYGAYRALLCIIEADIECDSLRFWPIAGDIHLEAKLEQLISGGRELFITMNISFPKPFDLCAQARAVLLSTSVSFETLATAVALINACCVTFENSEQCSAFTQMQREELEQLRFEALVHVAPVVIECLLYYLTVSLRACVRSTPAIIQVMGSDLPCLRRLMHHCCRYCNTPCTS